MQRIQSFIQNDYSFERFRDFVISLFGKNIGVKTPREVALNKDPLQSYIQVCDVITLDSARNLGVFVFKTNKITSKVALHQELKRFMEGEALSAILAVFYTPDSDSSEFRLSLIRISLNCVPMRFMRPIRCISMVAFHGLS